MIESAIIIIFKKIVVGIFLFFFCGLAPRESTALFAALVALKYVFNFSFF